MKAAVCREFGRPLVIEDAFRVRLAACGSVRATSIAWKARGAAYCAPSLPAGRAPPDLEKHSQCWYNGGVTLVVIGGPTEERVENAVRAFEAAGFRRASAIAEDLKQGNIVVPLRVGAAEILKQADDRGILYALVHHGPDDRIKDGTYARAHHRVEAPELIELARRLGANQKMLVTCVAFAFKEGIPKDSAFVVDARCLDNPYWVDDLRDLDGRDPRIAQFVLDQREAMVLLDSLCTMLGALLPAYRARGRMELTLAFGCTGGRQRSVVLALELARRLQARGDLDVGVELRELEQR